MDRRFDAPAPTWNEPSAAQRTHALTLATLVGSLVAFLFLALCTTGAQAQDAASRAPTARAHELLSMVRFLRHAPGHEALGIAYVTAYLQTASAERVEAEPFDALGTMAERLALRASRARPGDTATAQVEAVAAYGVRFTTHERDGRQQLCYDGEAFRRVLALKPTSGAQARALLALTRHDCVDPQLPLAARTALDAWRADLLDLPWPRGYDDLPQVVKSRLHLRRAGLWAARAHQQARLGRPAQAAADRAAAELAAVDSREFDDEDRLEYTDAALHVGAARRAAPGQDAMARASAAGLRLVTSAGDEPGQTCVRLLAAESTASRDRGPRLLAERCTLGTVWTASLAVRPAGDALVLAVQPPEGGTELWLFRAEHTLAGSRVDSAAARARTPWRIDVLAPAPGTTGALSS